MPTDGRDPHLPPSPETALAAAGRRPEWTHGIVSPPVYRASTVVYASVAEMEAAARAPDVRLYYGRRGTPTQWALAEALTALEPGAAGTLLFPSGVAALATAILAVCRPGSHILLPDSAYEPTASFVLGFARDHGIAADVYDPLLDAEGIARLFCPETALLLLESPGSMTFEVQDVPGLAAAARAAGVTTLLDNSWAASWVFKGIPAGCDMVMQSLTKYVGGHSDLLMGAVSATPALLPQLRRTAHALGQCVSADDAALALRGYRTLGVRLARHAASALAVARWLAEQPLVTRVLHPALPSCPGHARFLRDFTGSSGLFAFELAVDGPDIAARFCDPMHHFRLGYSWGGFESLIVPARPHRRLAPPPAGARFRVSIGLEDPADLIADLAAALDRVSPPASA